MNEKSATLYQKGRLRITDWADSDKPREKLLALGKHALSDAELIAILLGSGSDEDTAVSLARKILGDLGNDLNQLGRRSVSDFTKYRGMGPAKSITLVAAMELGRRRQMTVLRDKPHIQSSRDAYNCLAGRMMDLTHEEFWILCLNQANKVEHMRLIGRGGVAGVIADPKVVFREALAHNACGLVLAHNHPSGSIRPSEPDIQLTHKLSNAGKFLDIHVYDHLIIAGNDYYSFADAGRLNG